jgi:hypothetical protein
VPAGTLSATLTVTTADVVVPVSGDGVTETVTPPGRPVIVTVTLPEKPPPRTSVRFTVPDPPCCMLSDVGEAVIWMDSSGPDDPSPLLQPLISAAAKAVWEMSVRVVRM